MSGFISPSEPVIRHPVEHISKDISKDEAFSVEMGNAESKSHHFDDLPETSSFRIVKLLPGKRRDPISCETEIADLHGPPQFEAISYIWDDSIAKITVTCDKVKIKISVNLQRALAHLRLEDKPRYLWAHELCVDRKNTAEQSHQARLVHSIYRASQKTLIWIGSDTAGHLAEIAVKSIIQISDFLCQHLQRYLPEISVTSNVYRDIIYENRKKLPPPNKCEFSTETVWHSLIWFYSHAYFTGVSIFEEINANKRRSVQCGHETVEWERVELVAGYMILDGAFSKRFGFDKTHCWWATILTTAQIRQPRNWLTTLYLASNFKTTDPRDKVYGLRGLLKHSIVTPVLEPDYSKPLVDVYRDAVEASFLKFHNLDALLYVAANESPSWVPQWDKPMLFRNPFRFSSPVPWRPAGDREPAWIIDPATNTLTVSGSIYRSIKSVESYNQAFFGKVMFESPEGRHALKRKWETILQTARANQPAREPLKREVVTALAMSFLFSLDENNQVADANKATRTFVAYLMKIIDDELLHNYIPHELQEESAQADGDTFGKPVWESEYPNSSFFVAEDGHVGCCITPTAPGDVIAIIPGCTYPLILRSEGQYYYIRGYAYVHGIMMGEIHYLKRLDFLIR